MVLFFPVRTGTAAVLNTKIVRITVETDPFRIRFSDQMGDDFLAGVGREYPDDRYVGISFSPRPEGEDPGYLYPGYAWDRFRDEENREWYRCETAEIVETEPDLWEIECSTNDPEGGVLIIRIGIVELDIIRIEVEPVFSRDIDRVSLAFQSGSDEHFFGLGERFHGADQKGHTLSCWSEEGSLGLGEEGEGFIPFPGNWGSTNWPVPFFMSSRGYGFLLATGYRTNYELTSVYPDAFRVEVEGPTMRAYVFYGPDPRGILFDYTLLVGGRPPLPPPWVFAPWNDAVGGESLVRRQVENIRKHRIPSGVIWTEDWALPMGSFSVNRDYYPNLEDLIDEIHRKGFRFLTYYRPYLIQGTPEFDAGVAGGWVIRKPEGDPFVFPVVFQKVAQVDFTNDQARAWYQSLLRRGILLGVDGWMLDYGEYTPPQARFSDGRDGRELHNLYPVLAQAAVKELLDTELPGGDYVFFCRSGYLGSQSFVGVAWPGDQNTSWEDIDGFPAVIPAGLSLGMSGVALFGPDIAGYHSFFNPPADRELFYRWVQLGALTPVMRTHHGRPGGNWTYDTDEETLDLYREYARLHIRIFPYLYKYAAESRDTGMPIMRHLFLHYPSNPEVYGLDYQYLLGEEFLVAPVIKNHAREREVYLPHGEWFDFWTDKQYQGPGWITVPAPLERIPLFVRGGAIIPVLFPGVETLSEVEEFGIVGFDQNALSVWIYPGGETSFLMEDGTKLSFRGRAEGWSQLPLGFELSNPRKKIPEVADAEEFSGTELCWRHDPLSQRLLLRVKTPGGITISSGDEGIGEDPLGISLSIEGAPRERQYEFSIFYPLPDADGCGMITPFPRSEFSIEMPEVLVLLVGYLLLWAYRRVRMLS